MCEPRLLVYQLVCAPVCIVAAAAGRQLTLVKHRKQIYCMLKLRSTIFGGSPSVAFASFFVNCARNLCLSFLRFIIILRRNTPI